MFPFSTVYSKEEPAAKARKELIAQITELVSLRGHISWALGNLMSVCQAFYLWGFLLFLLCSLDILQGFVRGSSPLFSHLLLVNLSLYKCFQLLPLTRHVHPRINLNLHFSYLWTFFNMVWTSISKCFWHICSWVVWQLQFIMSKTLFLQTSLPHLYSPFLFMVI